MQSETPQRKPGSSPIVLRGFRRRHPLRLLSVITNPIRLLIFIALALLCFAPVNHASAGTQNSEESGRTWAVVIGVSRYEKLPGGQQIQFADRDAIAFADSLEKLGVNRSNIRLLTGSEATVAAIKATIGNWLARSASGADIVYIFFSGHGFVERDFTEAYLLGYDSNPEEPYTTALSLSELRHALTIRVRANRVLIIADAARRDFFPSDDESNRDADSFVRAFDLLSITRPGVSAILASGPGEYSREGRRWSEMGVFTKHLVDGLSGGALPRSDGIITAEEVFNFTSAKVSDDTSNKQHPWRSKTSLAAITIFQPKDAARAQTAENRMEEPPAPVTASPPTPPIPVATGGRPARPENPPVESSPTARSQPAVPPPAANRDRAEPEKEEPATKPSTPIVRAESQPVTKVETRNSAPEVERKPAPSTTPGSARPEKIAETTSPPRPSTTQPPRRSGPVPPGTQPVKGTTPPEKPANETLRAEIPDHPLPAPRRPVIAPPRTDEIAAASTERRSETGVVTSGIPGRPEEGAAPTPLILQFQMAIESGNLVEPKNSSAWDIYQQLSRDRSAASQLSRFKTRLGDALMESGKNIVGGDVRSDNISNKIEDFRRAGQIFNRARTLDASGEEAVALEKLSAAQALIALQFYDEAERSLEQLKSAKLAPVENAMGLLYLGKLEFWQAERAFKRAIEIAPDWAAPHYNLAMLYRHQNSGDSLSAFERAASLASDNPHLLTALGDEYFNREQWQKATDAYRKAVALSPNDDTLRTKLGHALFSQGLREEADREYQKATQLRGKQP